MFHLDPNPFAFGRKRKSWVKLEGRQIFFGKDSSPLISTSPFLFSYVNHLPPPTKDASIGVEREIVLSQITAGLKLLDAYPTGTASNCLGCLGVGASVS